MGNGVPDHDKNTQSFLHDQYKIKEEYNNIQALYKDNPSQHLPADPDDLPNTDKIEADMEKLQDCQLMLQSKLTDQASLKKYNEDLRI